MTRTNTSRPTGPRTPEGKRRSSLNALKHGLHATSPQALELIARETGVDFETILDEMRAHYEPADPVEEQLVKRIARCAWRLALAESMERRLMERRADPIRPGASYQKILRYEQLVDIHLHRAIAALAKKRRAENKLSPHNELQPSSDQA